LDYEKLSLWLETAPGSLAPRPALDGDRTADVVIMGGGFSGLWTAYYLLKAEPGLDVVVVEAEICGYGASGRNGGWVSPRYALNPGVLTERFGAEAARAQILAMHDTVDEMGRVCEEEGIDCNFRRADLLSIARGEGQIASVRASHAGYAALGLGPHNMLIGPEAIAERVKVADAREAILTPGAAMIHPARLARGLAETVERLGGTIHEKTRGLRVEPGATPGLVTDHGVLTARKALIIAGEAYLPGFSGYGRDLIPMSSMIVATEPLTQAQWAAIGWSGGEGLSSQIASVDYLSRTADGRILYGTRGAPYLFGSKAPNNAADLAPAFERMKRNLVEWFPDLGGIGFSHQWSGYLGVTRNWTPSIYFDADQKIGGLYGYTGRGVPNTNLAGRIVSGLVTGRETGLEALPAARLRSPRWETEPFRWLGVRYAQDALGRIDKAAREGRTAPFDAPLARKLTRY
jgi:glycine/D-amino acid oxidase-like deaminating enzyme